MAVTVVDTRTVINDADSLTSWTGASILNTTAGQYAEATGCVAEAYNIATGIMFYSTSINVSGLCVYVQSYTNALQNSWKAGTLANSSHSLYISDGTNDVCALQAGSDRDVFKHSDTQVSFQSFLFDPDYLTTKNSNGEIYMNAGTVGGFNPASVTEVGSRFVTLSKALGGGDNCFVDIMRYGNDGLIIYGGSSGSPGLVQEIVDLDRSSANTRGHGLIRTYTAGAFGCQGTLQFGLSGSSYFVDSNISITFEDRDVEDDKFKFIVTGTSSASNRFELTNSSISSARPGVEVICGSNTDFLTFDGVSFNSLLNDVSFPTDSSGNTHSVINCSFNACGLIDPGTVDFNNNSISNGTYATGSLLLDSDGTANWSDLTLNSDGGVGHGIYITATGSYAFTSIFFNNFGASGSTSASVYNNSGGLVTINVGGGGDTPTYRNGTSASTVVNNNITVTLTGLKDNTEVRVYTTTTTTELAGIENATAGTIDNRTFAFSLSASLAVDIVVHNIDYEYLRIDGFVIPNSDSSVPIQQRFDRNYSNPI